jgi:hypothetical protein
MFKRLQALIPQSHPQSVRSSEQITPDTSDRAPSSARATPPSTAQLQLIIGCVGDRCYFWVCGDRVAVGGKDDGEFGGGGGEFDVEFLWIVVEVGEGCGRSVEISIHILSLANIDVIRPALTDLLFLDYYFSLRFHDP